MSYIVVQPPKSRGDVEHFLSRDPSKGDSYFWTLFPECALHFDTKEKAGMAKSQIQRGGLNRPAEVKKAVLNSGRYSFRG